MTTTRRTRLRSVRIVAKLTQEELAAMAGVTQSAISALERGDTEGPSYETAIRLARALKVDATDLFPVSTP